MSCVSKIGRSSNEMYEKGKMFDLGRYEISNFTLNWAWDFFLLTFTVPLLINVSSVFPWFTFYFTAYDCDPLYFTFLFLKKSLKSSVPSCAYLQNYIFIYCSTFLYNIRCPKIVTASPHFWKHLHHRGNFNEPFSNLMWSETVFVADTCVDYIVFILLSC